MKKVGAFIVFMMMIILVLPILIVKGCSFYPESGFKSEANIKVYISDQKKVVTMDIEEYVKGVVAAEMPAEYEIEALKAQAVAARTYAYGRLKRIYTSDSDVSIHKGADICSDPGHCQAFINKKEALKRWGKSSSKEWSKIEKSVSETRGIYIMYKGIVINPVFHSNSGGMTENSEDVWEGVNLPYLRSVVSEGEETSSEYESVTAINTMNFCSKLKNKYPEIKINEKNIYSDIKVLNYTAGGRVKNIKIGSVTIKGTDFRSLFSLRSANFKIEKSDNSTLKITTIGNGHGVGMSQCGANCLAKNGGSYKEILKYYYKGTVVQKIN